MYDYCANIIIDKRLLEFKNLKNYFSKWALKGFK